MSDVQQALIGDEEWAPVVGFEGLYEVSSLGRVHRVGKPKPLTPLRNMKNKDANRVGWQVALHDAERYKTPRRRLIARLVLEAFVGPAPEDKPYAIHNNYDNTDNALANLRWGRLSETRERN